MNGSAVTGVPVKLLFFAKARELTGCSKIDAELPLPERVTSEQILREIVKLFPALKVIKDTVIVSLNQEYISQDEAVGIQSGDEIAVIPPLSGDIHSKVTSPHCGALSTFIGTTRNNFCGRKVVKLEYEAYEPMAVKVLGNICDQIRSKWNVENIAMYHRLGEVPVSEASVVIAISSVHRKESLNAVAYAIDELKANVPIWKKEVYDGGETAEWKENKECKWSISV